jgi:hypothetical protein
LTGSSGVAACEGAAADLAGFSAEADPDDEEVELVCDDPHPARIAATTRSDMLDVMQIRFIFVPPGERFWSANATDHTTNKTCMQAENFQLRGGWLRVVGKARIWNSAPRQ